MLNRKDFKALCIFASIFISLLGLAKEKENPPLVYDPFAFAIQKPKEIAVPRELAIEVPEVVRIRYPGIDGFIQKVDGKETKWRACSGVVFSKGEKSCVLTAGHCMSGILASGKYTERAQDEVLKGIIFENASNIKAKIDTTDLKSNVQLLGSLVPQTEAKSAKQLIDSEIAHYENVERDLAVVKLNFPLKGYSFDALVPQTSPAKNDFINAKGFLIGGGTMLPTANFFKTKWPVRNQIEQKLHYCKQTYISEISEASFLMQNWLLGGYREQQDIELAAEMRRFHNELLKKKPAVIILGASVQEMGYGDSGAPFFMLDKNKKKKIYGIAIASNSEHNYTQLVSITAKNQRAWISERLKEMGCN